MVQTPAPQHDSARPDSRLGGGYLDDEAYAYASGKRRPSHPRTPVLSAPRAGQLARPAELQR